MRSTATLILASSPQPCPRTLHAIASCIVLPMLTSPTPPPLSNGEGIFEADDTTPISALIEDTSEVVMADIDGDG